jgi:hypothetical protein
MYGVIHHTIHISYLALTRQEDLVKCTHFDRYTIHAHVR